MLNRKLLRDLMTLRTQCVTTAILVVCGVSLLISAWSAYYSLRLARDRYYTTHAFADLFGELKKAPRDLKTKLQAVEGVEILETRVVVDGLVQVRDQDEPAIGRFISVPPGAQPKLNQIYLRQGHLPVLSDIPEVLVHEAFAKAHGFKPGDHFAAIIEGERKTIKVSGVGLSPEFVYSLSPAIPFPDDKHFGIFWMPQSTLETLAGMSAAFNSILVKMSSSSSNARDERLLNVATHKVKDELDQLLKPYGSHGIYSRDRQPSNMFVEDEITQQKISAIFNPTIFLAVAAFLIHVIISRLIALHRSQIAILKALGYRNREVSFHYVKLIIVMMLLGAYPGMGLGILLGQWMTKNYDNFFHFPKLEFSLSGSAVLIGIVSGILPGFLGAWKSIHSVFRLAPAEAMRPPVPSAYHAMLFEKLSFWSNLDTKSRIIGRNLLFRPTRLIFSILGVAAALAIIVTSGSWKNALDYMLVTQFQHLQREDLSVGFLRPLPLSALRQLETIPGVLAVEGYRLVPVRMHYLNHQREISILGWPSTALMRQRIDSHMNTIPLPDHGVLLSRTLHQVWGLSEGDWIEVEVLEGKPRTISLRVVGFTEELMGNMISMKIQALWSVMGEQTGYNLAALKADPRKLNQIYVRLEESPEVKVVSVKRTLYTGFQSTMGSMIRIFTLILVCFALAISIGIIYNSVRVSFSERSWELASLRILGFRKGEVFWVLFAEILTQVLISLVPGCFLGLGLATLSARMIHTETFRFPIVIHISTYASAILVILLALSVSSAIVFRMTEKLNLAEALKARE